MAKDSFWFKHDSNAGRDLKLLELTHIYTHWGKGIYWDVIEVLREQDGYKFDKTKLQTLCSMIMCNDFSKFKSWYNDCIKLRLFIEDKSYFYSQSLINRMVKWETSKANGDKGGRPIGSINKKPKRNPTETKGITETKPLEEKREEDIRKEKNLKLATNQKIFEQELLSFQKEYDIQMLKAFYNYWSEPNQAKTKMKKELEKTWDTKRRLVTWYNRSINYKQ